MRKIFVVAFREYQAAVRTKAFILSMVMMPLLMGGSFLIQLLLRDRVDIRDKKLAVLDQSGALFDALQRAAEARNEKDIFREEGETRKQTRPRFLLDKVDSLSDDLQEAALKLSESVRAGSIFAFLIIGPDVFEPGADPARAAIHYHSNTPTYDDLVDWLSPVLNERIREARFAKLNIDSDAVKKALQHTRIASLGLVSRGLDGRIQPAERINRLASIFLPMGFMMLMFMVIMVGAQPLLQAVIEEKMQRIAEVLLGSVSPFQLMMGKLIGTVGVSLTLVSVYLLGGFLALRYSGFGQHFPPTLVVWFIVYTILAVLLYGSVFAAIGAAVSDLKEAQSILTPVMLVLVAPMFVWLNVLKEPSSTFSIVASLIPPATPMLMIMRQSVPPYVPIWQPLLGVVLVLLTTLFCVWAAGRIFRVGILMQGRGAKVGEMFRWVFSG